MKVSLTSHTISPILMEVDHSSHDDTAHLADLVRSAHAAITSVTMDGRIRSWNAGAERLFGFSAGEALGAEWMMLIPEELKEEAMAYHARVQAGETFTVETVCKHRTGRLVEVSMSLAPIRDPQGNIVAVCAVTHDITGRDTMERKLQMEAAIRQRAEKALEASTRDFRTFFEMANVGNVMADARTSRFLRVNRCFCEMTGYTEAEVLNLTAYDLTDPADVERDRTGWEEAVRLGVPSYMIEKRYRRKDGSVFWVHVTSTLVRDFANEPLHAIGVIRDVTDRRQAMEELRAARAELEERVAVRTGELMKVTMAARESANRLETLIQNSPLAIISIDMKARVQLWNPAAEELFGWTEAEVIGQPLPNLPGENRAKYEAEIRDLVGNPSRLRWETIRQRRDGSIVEVEMWRIPLRTPQQEIYAITAILMDVTERKFLERALLEAAERESRRIGQELHDHLCQHLLGAAFSAKAVAMGLPPDLPASTELHHLARLINSAVQQARDIARGLNPVEMDAAGLMTALQALTERPRAGIACRLECARNVLLLNSEAALHAYRIAQEAVANAVQHSGGTEIVVRLSQNDQNIVMQIQDNGRGLPPRVNDCAGLGLKIMKYRAHAISGKVTVDTARDHGTSVVLLLPK